MNMIPVYVFAGFVAGYVLCDIIADGKLAKISEFHAKELRAMADQRDRQARSALKIQQDLTDALAAADKQTIDEVNNAKAKGAAQLASIRDGSLRLSIPAACQPTTRLPKDSAATSMVNAEGRADIDRAAAERIVSLTQRGDEAIRQLTALQEYVNTLVTHINARPSNVENHD